MAALLGEPLPVPTEEEVEQARAVPVLVSELNHLIERCEVSDAALAQLIAFEVLPKDRSYLDGGAGIIDLVREFAPQIAINAGLVLNLLARLAISSPRRAARRPARSRPR